MTREEKERIVKIFQKQNFYPLLNREIQAYSNNRESIIDAIEYFYNFPLGVGGLFFNCFDISNSIYGQEYWKKVLGKFKIRVGV